MKFIHDKRKIERAIRDSICPDILHSLNVPLFLIQYDEGESIIAPTDEELYFQIVTEGSLSIYFIRDDGSTYSLSTGGKGYVLGDLDLFVDQTDSVFAEATSPLTAIAVDARQYREELMSDPTFLQFIARGMAIKITKIMDQDAVYSSLNDRVLNYLRYKCPEQTLRGVEKSAFKLHCSARQLQRILNGFVEEGIAEKVGKGAYHLLR